MSIREKVNRYSNQNNINVKVIFSGIAAASGEREPKFSNCRTPIDIANDHHRALYLGQNPFRPLTYQSSTGNWMTTLVLNSNYLAYEGDNW